VPSWTIKTNPGAAENYRSRKVRLCVNGRGIKKNSFRDRGGYDFQPNTSRRSIERLPRRHDRQGSGGAPARDAGDIVPHPQFPAGSKQSPHPWACRDYCGDVTSTFGCVGNLTGVLAENTRTVRPVACQKENTEGAAVSTCGRTSNDSGFEQDEFVISFPEKAEGIVIPIPLCGRGISLSFPPDARDTERFLSPTRSGRGMTTFRRLLRGRYSSSNLTRHSDSLPVPPIVAR